MLKGIIRFGVAIFSGFALGISSPVETRASAFTEPNSGQVVVPSEISEIFTRSADANYECVRLDGTCLFKVVDGQGLFDFNRTETINANLTKAARVYHRSENESIEIEVAEAEGAVFQLYVRLTPSNRRYAIMTVLEEDMVQPGLRANPEETQREFSRAITEALQRFSNERQPAYRESAVMRSVAIIAVSAVLFVCLQYLAIRILSQSTWQKGQTVNEGDVNLFIISRRFAWFSLLVLRVVVIVGPLVICGGFFPEVRPLITGASVVGWRLIRSVLVVVTTHFIGLGIKAGVFRWESLKLDTPSLTHRQRAAISTQTKVLNELLGLVFTIISVAGGFGAFIGAFYFVTVFSIVSVGVWVVFVKQGRDAVAGWWYILCRKAYVRSDFISLSGIEGKDLQVDSVSLFDTVLTEPWEDGAGIRVHHSYLNDHPIKNRSPKGWVNERVLFLSRYEQNCDQVKSLLEGAIGKLRAESNSGVLAKAGPVFGPRQVKEGIEWKVPLKISSQVKTNVREVTDRFTFLVIQEFEQAGLDFPHWNQVDLHIKE